MASETPERIWLQQSASGLFNAVLEPHDREFYRHTEYVLASTHQRALEALETIASLHIPDMPAHFGGDELEWAQRHVASLRRIATEALTRIKEATDAPDRHG
mgnify:CR=1 FL=1